jgi:hypothetical protein
MNNFDRRSSRLLGADIWCRMIVAPDAAPFVCVVSVLIRENLKSTASTFDTFVPNDT